MFGNYRRVTSTDQGLVLISALWLLILLSSIALSLARDSRLALQSTSIYADELKARSTVEGAVFEFIHCSVIGASEIRALEKLRARDIEFEIDYEREKLDLNAASLQQIANHLLSLGYAQPDEPAAMIVDFRDKDDDAQNGDSEIALFNSKGAKVPPKNKAFQHIFELMQIPGLQTGLNDALLDSVTIFGSAETTAVITLKVGTTVGRATANAEVSVRINRHSAYPYRILQWRWQ